MAGPKGPIDRSKKIMEKNAAKGQFSMDKFLGAQKYDGVTSNSSAFNHYAVQTNTYTQAASKINGQKGPG